MIQLIYMISIMYTWIQNVNNIFPFGKVTLMILDPQGHSVCFPLLLEELQWRGKDLSSSDVGGGAASQDRDSCKAYFEAQSMYKWHSPQAVLLQPTEKHTDVSTLTYP